MRAESFLAIVLMIVAVLFILTAIAVFIVTYLARNVSVIRRANPLFCYFTLSGLILAASAIFFMVGRPTSVTCAAQIWFGGIGFALVFG